MIARVSSARGAWLTAIATHWQAAIRTGSSAAHMFEQMLLAQQRLCDLSWRSSCGCRKTAGIWNLSLCSCWMLHRPCHVPHCHTCEEAAGDGNPGLQRFCEARCAEKVPSQVEAARASVANGRVRDHDGIWLVAMTRHGPWQGVRCVLVICS